MYDSKIQSEKRTTWQDPLSSQGRNEILTPLALAGISSFDYYLDLKNLRNSEDNPFEDHLAGAWWNHTNVLERQHEPEIQVEFERSYYNLQWRRWDGCARTMHECKDLNKDTENVSLQTVISNYVYLIIDVNDVYLTFLSYTPATHELGCFHS